MEPDSFDEASLFEAIALSRVRALLIGRQAMVVYGAPVQTFDYDFWLHRDDIEELNAAVAHLGLTPDRTPEEARKGPLYRLQNSELVDVFVARSLHGHGLSLTFDELWSRRRSFEIHGSTVALPSIADLIALKQLAGRQRDLADVVLLETLRRVLHHEKP